MKEMKQINSKELQKVIDNLEKLAGTIKELNESVLFSETLEKLKKETQKLVNQNIQKNKKTERSKKIYTIANKIYYLRDKKNKDELDYIKLQKYIEEYNKISYHKEFSIENGEVVSREK